MKKIITIRQYNIKFKIIIFINSLLFTRQSILPMHIIEHTLTRPNYLQYITKYLFTSKKNILLFKSFFPEKPNSLEEFIIK